MKNDKYESVFNEVEAFIRHIENIRNGNNGDDDEYDGNNTVNLSYIEESLDNIKQAIHDIDPERPIDDVTSSIDALATEVHDVSEKVESASYEITTGLDSIYGGIEKVCDLLEYTYRDIAPFIDVTRMMDNGECVIKIRHDSILLIEENDGHAEIGFTNGTGITTRETPDEIIEKIRRAKRTEYEVYQDTLKENGLTEDEILCYVAHHQPDLAAPVMLPEEILKMIDEVKKAKSDGFDFSIETLSKKRAEREAEIMKKGNAEINASFGKVVSE